MPLIEEDTLRTDRRSHGKGLWLVVAGGVLLVWAVGALVIAMFRNVASATLSRPMPAAVPPAPPLATMGPFTNANLQTAVIRYGAWDFQTAATAIGAIPSEARLSAMDKHAYYR